MITHFEENIIFTRGRNSCSPQLRTFTVPSGCSRLTLQYDRDAASGLSSQIFLMIKDPDGKIRFLKELSYSEPVIGIGAGAQDTTTGGVPGPVDAGEWQILLFLTENCPDQLPDGNEISWTLTVSDEEAKPKDVIGGSIWTDGDLSCTNYDFEKIFVSGAGWYKGDLHTHTRLSGGIETPQNASRKASMMELDFYVPTECNALHTGWPDTKIMIMPGMEISTSAGHLNLIGVDRAPRRLEHILADREKTAVCSDMEDVISESKNRGWLISMNHPFLPGREWKYRDLCLADLDCLEIINNPTLEADSASGAEEANEKAVYLADLLWEDGYRICAVGGSDSRRRLDDPYPGTTEPSVPGDPATWLYMEHLSPAAMKKALRTCSGYVSRHCSLRTDLRFGKQLPREQEWLHYEIHLRGYRRKPDIFYKHNGMRISCAGLTKEDNGWCVHGSIYLNRTAPYHCIRFGAEDENGTFLFYANPITRGRTAHRFITFGEAAAYLEDTFGRRHRPEFLSGAG